MRIRRAAASDVAHSAACSSSASQSSPTHRPNAETPHQLLSLPFPKKKPLTLFYIICTLPVVDLPHLLAHARVIFYVQWPDHFQNAGAASVSYVKSVSQEGTLMCAVDRPVSRGKECCETYLTSQLINNNR